MKENDYSSDVIKKLNAYKALLIAAISVGFFFIFDFIFSISFSILSINIFQGEYSIKTVDDFNRTLKPQIEIVSEILSYCVLVLVISKASQFLTGGKFRRNEYTRAIFSAGEISEIITGIVYGVITFSIVGIISGFVFGGPIDKGESLFLDTANLFKSSGFLFCSISSIILLSLSSTIEEFVFRGVLFEGFKESFGIIISSAVSTTLFVLMHFSVSNATDIILFLILGIIALWLRIKFNALGPAISFHITYNLGILSLILIRLKNI